MAVEAGSVKSECIRADLPVNLALAVKAYRFGLSQLSAGNPSNRLSLNYLVLDLKVGGMSGLPYYLHNTSLNTNSDHINTFSACMTAAVMMLSKMLTLFSPLTPTRVLTI